MSVTLESPAVLSHYSPAYLAEYIGYQVIGVAIAFMVLETVFVILRSLARRKTLSPLGWDDYLIIPALVVNLGMCAHGISQSTTTLRRHGTRLKSSTVMVNITGAGHHLPAVIIQHGPAKLVVWSKMIYASIWIYSVAVVLPKMSILCLYLRIFVRKPQRITCYVLMGVLITHMISTVFAATFECTPVAHLWDKTIAGHCFDAVAFYRIASLPNIITDVIMLFLPMPMIWHLKLSTARRISLTFVFLTGSMLVPIEPLRHCGLTLLSGIVASGIRTAIFFRINALQDTTCALPSFNDHLGLC